MKKELELVPAGNTPMPMVIESRAVTPMELLSVAVSQGADIDKLEKLMALQERWEANEARKAFDAAISAARSEIKPIVKNAEVDFKNKEGKRTNYKYETLDGIAKSIDPILSKHGLSYRFRSAQEGALLRVTCIIAHSGGHSEETTLSCAPVAMEGKKNSYQSIGEGATYLQRYTLKLGLGLSAAKDTDAVSDEQPDIEPDITDWLTVIGDSTTLDELKKNYTDAYAANKQYKGCVAQINAAKDAKKKELSK